ncbi:MAG: hypothetical protein HC810_08705, partial [Acaryochloridaceae cyanobacterium RL_2_7]|nr:hypothetical protein [Acaryochloridaceae cyanobacterium RL_2_7]
MFKMVVGHSEDPDTSEALLEILNQCQEQLDGEQPQAGILLAALEFDYQELLDGILALYPNLILVGCTTAGEVSSVMGYQQDSVLLTLFCSDEVQFQAGVARNLSENPASKTQATYHSLCEAADFTPKLCLLFPEATKSVYFSVVEAMASVADQLPVIGGVAGGKPQTDSTYQFFGNEVFSDSAPMLLLGGNLKVSHAYASGWHPFGKTGQITKSHGNAIYEIDHQPPAEFYQHYFKTFSPSTAYPLAIYPPGEENSLLRAAIELDPVQGHLYMGGYIPENSTARITTSEHEHIIQAAKTSVINALKNYPGE